MRAATNPLSFLHISSLSARAVLTAGQQTIVNLVGLQSLVLMVHIVHMVCTACPAENLRWGKFAFANVELCLLSSKFWV